jgi:YidC/Oxa1 family membrane protein insertase
MDRTSIIILAVCFVLLMLWYPLANKVYPPKPLPRTNTQTSATGAVQQTSAPTATATATNIPQPAPPPALATNAPEQTLVLTNVEARYTFTSHGGGLKLIELVGYPAKTCVPKGSPGATNWAPLNLGAALPVLAISGPSAIFDDGLFTLASAGPGVRAEKRLTNGLAIVKQFELSSNDLLRATVRIENVSSNPVTVPSQQWAAGSATPLAADEADNVRGLYWYDGEDADHVTPDWFANRSGWSCIGVPSTPRFLYEAGSSNVAWTVVHNQFFVLAVIPNQPALKVLAEPAIAPVASESGWSNSPARPLGVQASLAFPEFTLAPGQTLERTFHIYAGPREYKTLQRIGLAFKNDLDAIMGWWLGFFAKLLLLSMNGLHALGLSYAISIIAITVIIKLLFWPLTQASTRSMKRLQALQPQMKAIQEKFKDDPVKMNRKTMEFMREHKVNPIGGCLPMLLQIPVFIGFYQMIQSAIELRGERFLWACDLSRSDTIFIVPGMNFPVNPLPLVMGVTMLWQARLTPPSPGMDPMQQKIMRYMPLMILVFLYNFSAGLTLYWTVQNLLTIAQMKLTKAKEPDQAGAPAKPAPPPASKKKR